MNIIEHHSIVITIGIIIIIIFLYSYNVYCIISRAFPFLLYFFILQ